MYQFFLAMRYLWTRPLSWVSVIGIWLSVTAMVTTVSIMSGFLGELQGTLRGITADVVINPRPREVDVRIGAGPPQRQRIPPPDYETTRALLAAVDGVAATCPRLLRPALLQTDRERRRLEMKSCVMMVGVDPEAERATTRLFEYVARSPEEYRVDDPQRPFWIDESSVAPEHRGKPVVLLGLSVMTHHGLTKGDVIRITSMSTVPPEEGEPIESASTGWVVGGGVRTGHFEKDGQSIYVLREDARRATTSPTDSSEICVRAADDVDVERLAAVIARTLDENNIHSRVESWRTHYVTELAPILNQRTILAVLLAFFVMVACFNIFATLTILVSDKTRDIGLLSAMGATRAGVARVFTGCGVIISSVGALLGAGTGYLLATHINRLNDFIGEVTGVKIFRASIYAFDSIPIDIQPWFVALVAGTTVAFAVICALLPSLRAARMDPVRALRYE